MELEKESEIKKERELEKGRAAPALLGRYDNVRLTEVELTALQIELPDQWQHYIERLSEYIASTDKCYKNHLATIRRWAADDAQKNAPKQ